jgi:hypothetical protein
MKATSTEVEATLNRIASELSALNARCEPHSLEDMASGEAYAGVCSALGSFAQSEIVSPAR